MDNSDQTEQIGELKDCLRQLTQTVNALAKDVVGNLKSRVEHFEAFLHVESTITEKEVTKRAMTFFQDHSYDVDLLPFQKVPNAQGSTVVEWDGIFVAEPLEQKTKRESFLCLVEAKHKVAPDHIPNRLEYMRRFKTELQDFRSDIRNAKPCHRSVMGALEPFKNHSILLFLGGLHFSKDLIDSARKQGIFCISVNGSRYDVCAPPSFDDTFDSSCSQ